MQVIFFLLIMFTAESSISRRSHLSCSKSGTTIFYINGIALANPVAAELQFRDFHNSLARNLVDSKVSLEFKFLKNSSEGEARDIAEAALLYLERSNIPETPFLISLIAEILFNPEVMLRGKCKKTNDDFLKSICKEFFYLKQKGNPRAKEDLGKMREILAEEVRNERKVIFVTHSAGALFGDHLLDHIKKVYPAHYPYSSMLSLARPLSTNHSRSTYINFKSDKVLAAIGKTGAPVPAPNADLYSTCPLGQNNEEAGEIFSNHDFLCYISSSGADGPTFLLQDPTFSALSLANDNVYRAAGELANNDPDCCGMRDGRIWINPDGSNGGFVTNNVTINYPNFFVSSDSQICSPFGTIVADKSGQPSSISQASKINGHFFSNSSFNLSNFKSDEGATLRLTNNSTRPKNVSFEIVHLKKNATFTNADGIYFYNSVFDSVITANGCPSVGEAISGLNVDFTGESTLFSKAVEVRGLSGKIIAKNSEFRGECLPRQSQTIIETPSSFSNLKVRGAQINSRIGNNVTIGPPLYETNPIIIRSSLENSSSIADGTNLFGNVLIFGCNISGTHGPEYHCADGVETGN